MLGAYPHVVSYLQAVNDAVLQNDISHKEPLPPYLRPSFQPQQAWCPQGKGKNSSMEDFIMVAEFSELEGPKPLMTIPKDGGANFDKNSFSVRILAVDHQSPAEGFSISEDAHVVLSDVEMGVFAFVYHLVLFDNTARGFVRPYCIAYITTDQRKLMNFYEELSVQFKKVARYLKYGNRMLFVGDLERHLRNLEYTKNVLLNQASKIRLRNVEGSDEIKDSRKNAENELYKALHMIQQSNLEIKEILSILKPLLSNRKLEGRFRLLEERAFQRNFPAYLDNLSLQNSWFNDLSTLDELNVRCGSLTEPTMSPLALFRPREYKPVLVKTKKAKRFNAPLRGLHELCSWGAKEGVRKLRNIHEYFKRDMVVLELQRNESRLLYPESSSISFGQCVGGNFLAGMELKKLLETEEVERNWSVLYQQNWGSTGSLDSIGSIKSTGSCYSLKSQLEASHASYDESIIQSTSSSPEGEFSLINSHKYYPDEEITQGEPAVSFFLFQNDEAEEEMTQEKAVTANAGSSSPRYKTKLPKNDDKKNAGSSSPRYKTKLPKNDEKCEKRSEVSDAIEIILQQRDSQLKAVDLTSNLSFVSVCSPSELNRGKDIIELDREDARNNQFYTDSVLDIETLKLYEADAGNTELSSTTFPQVKDSHPISMMNNVNPRMDNTSSRRHCQVCANSTCLCVNGHIKINGCNADYCREGCRVGDSEKICHACGNAQEHALPDKMNMACHIHNSEQCLSMDHGGNFLATDIFTKRGNNQCGQSQIMSKNVELVHHSDYKVVCQDFQWKTHPREDLTGNTEIEIKSPIQKNELKSFHMQLKTPVCKDKAVVEFPSLLSVCDDLLDNSETSRTSPSTQIILSRDVHAQDNLSPSSGKPDLLLKVGEYSKTSCSTQASNFLPPSQLQKYAHQIVRPAQLQQGKNCQAENESKSMRVRSAPEIASAFTITSPADFYSHVPDVGISAPCFEDSLLASGVPEVCDLAGYDNDYMRTPVPDTAGTWKPKCGVYAAGDWISNLAPGRPGFCLSEVFSTYINLEHVIFSLLCGRPVLIVGPVKLKAEVVKLVTALAAFVPAERNRKYQTILEWTSQHLTITDLTSLKLVGVCRPEKKSVGSLIPSAIKRACTIINIEKRVIIAPPYQGHFITALMSKRKVLKSDIQLLSFIEWWFMDILGKAFIFFHNFCLSSSGSILYSHSPNDQRDAYCFIVSGIMSRLGVKDCDCEIIEYLSELVKVSQLEPHIWNCSDAGDIVHPITLQHKVCDLFRC